MRRFILGAGVFAVVGAIAYSVLAATAFDSGDSARKPSGGETRLRIQPTSREVSCDSVVAVEVYLDDLEARPSVTDERFNRGLAAFDVTLKFDPAILIVERQLDVELNPDLSREDPDGDGRGTTFLTFPITPDNYEGTVYIGGGGVPTDWPEGVGQEEGPDPVAKGEPILLFTVRFRAIGEGVSPVGVVHPPADASEGERRLALDLLDYSPESYEPVTVEESGVTVKGGACPTIPTATPRPRQTATPAPPTPTPIQLIATVHAITPTPAVLGGRDDCPDDWSAYNDPDGYFSLCYPPKLAYVSVTDAVLPDEGKLFYASGGGRDSGFSLSARWHRYTAFGLGPPGPDTCAERTGSAYPALIIASEFLSLRVRGQDVGFCLTRSTVTVGGPEVRDLQGELTVAAGGSTALGYVHIYASAQASGFPAALDLIVRILDTLAFSAPETAE